MIEVNIPYSPPLDTWNASDSGDTPTKTERLSVSGSILRNPGQRENLKHDEHMRNHRKCCVDGLDRPSTDQYIICSGDSLPYKGIMYNRAAPFFYGLQLNLRPLEFKKKQL